MANFSLADRSLAERRHLEFQRLYDTREIAAYQLVGAVETVLQFFEAQDFDQAEAALKRALASYQQADSAVTDFLNSKKENSAHVHDTAA